MKAVILEKINHPLSVKDIECTPLKTGQVLTRNLASGLCGAQLHEIRGHKGNAKFLPHLMGHEGCGIVEDIGLGVTKVKKGDKVVMHWRQGSGIESDFPNYVFENKVITSGKVTTLSEFSIVSENRITPVPQDTPSELCAILGCALTTALGIIDNEVSFKFGESVAIIGCGGVGLNLIQGASMKNGFPIIAVENNLSKKELCMKSGANQFITDINSLNDQSVDIIIDTTGIPEVISNSINKLSGNGRMVLVGQPAPGRAFEVLNAVNLFNGFGKTIKATQGGMTDPTADIPRYIKMYKNGLLNIDYLFTHRFHLDEINEAFAFLKKGDAGRIIIDIFN